MTVAELIEKLQKLPQDLVVTYSADYDAYKVSTVEVVEYKTTSGSQREVVIG